MAKLTSEAAAKARKLPDMKPDDDDTDEQQAIKRHKIDEYVAKIVDPAQEKIVAADFGTWWISCCRFPTTRVAKWGPTTR